MGDQRENSFATGLHHANFLIVLRAKLVSHRNLFLFLALIAFVPAIFAVDVLTWHNDNARAGQNLSETILTPANVNFNQFGKLFVIPTDGQVYAQPLYVSNLSIPGNGIHNVIYVATEHDSVYACDADNGTLLWRVSLLKPGETLSDDRMCSSQISPEIGITATPVIDRGTGPHGTIYVVAISKNASN